MIREDADGDVSPSAHTEPVEEPICRDFNGNWVFRPEKMCVRNSNRGMMIDYGNLILEPSLLCCVIILFVYLWAK